VLCNSLGLRLSVLAKRLAVRSISTMTYSVPLGGTLNLNQSVNQSMVGVLGVVM